MPDNYVQDPYNTQNFNRYGYVLNNPLSYTDASGEFFWVAVGIGALIGAITQAVRPGATFGSIFGGALIGGLAGALGAGIGNVVAGGSFFGSQIATTIGFGSGFLSGFAGGFAGGFVGGAGTAWLNGANFGDGLGSGLKGGAIGGITAGLINGVSSGLNAVNQGREFWSGEKWNEAYIGFGGNNTLVSESEDLLIDWDVDKSMKLPQFSQRDVFDCSIAFKNSVDKYFNNLGQEKINSKWFALAKNQGGLTDRDIFSLYREGGYKGNVFSGNFGDKRGTLQWILNEMNANRAVQLSAQVSNSSQFHASLITRIRYLSDFSKFRISIMNPSPGTILNVNNFRTYNRLFSVWK